MDNEQRAHDLAIMAINFAKSDVDEGISEKFDIYQAYQATYAKMFELVNRDFANEK